MFQERHQDESAKIYFDQLGFTWTVEGTQDVNADADERRHGDEGTFNVATKRDYLVLCISFQPQGTCLLLVTVSAVVSQGAAYHQATTFSMWPEREARSGSDRLTVPSFRIRIGEMV
jgi:hypothetical protein